MERAGANGIASAHSSFCSSFVMVQYRIVFLVSFCVFVVA